MSADRILRAIQRGRYRGDRKLRNAWRRYLRAVRSEGAAEFARSPIGVALRRFGENMRAAVAAMAPVFAKMAALLAARAVPS